MTRKDFQLIANIVKTIQDDDARNQVACNFAVVLKRDNPRFRAEQFINACIDKE